MFFLTDSKISLFNSKGQNFLTEIVLRKVLTLTVTLTKVPEVSEMAWRVELAEIFKLFAICNFTSFEVRRICQVLIITKIRKISFLLQASSLDVFFLKTYFYTLFTTYYSSWIQICTEYHKRKYFLIKLSEKEKYKNM